MTDCSTPRHQAHARDRSTDPRHRRRRSAGRSPAWLLLGLLAAGCASAPLQQTGSLRSYADLERSDGLLTRSLLRVSRANVLAAKTVKIVPTAFSEQAGKGPLTLAQRRLITNVVDRTLCAGLSERFAVVGPSEPADLTVRAVVTHVTPTNRVAAGVSRVASVATSVALPDLPVPIPRIPIGLGSLSLEAEALGSEGRQEAVMIWGRGANALLDSGRVAREGDAYDLAAKFGGDFSDMLVTGKPPFKTLPSLPSWKQVRGLFGGAPRYPACAAFGRAPGIPGMIGGAIGLPPAWTDKGSGGAPETRS